MTDETNPLSNGDEVGKLHPPLIKTNTWTTASPLNLLLGLRLVAVGEQDFFAANGDSLTATAAWAVRGRDYSQCILEFRLDGAEGNISFIKVFTALQQVAEELRIAHQFDRTVLRLVAVDAALDMVLAESLPLDLPWTQYCAITLVTEVGSLGVSELPARPTDFFMGVLQRLVQAVCPPEFL